MIRYGNMFISSVLYVKTFDLHFQRGRGWWTRRQRQFLSISVASSFQTAILGVKTVGVDFPSVASKVALAFRGRYTGDMQARQRSRAKMYLVNVGVICNEDSLSAHAGMAESPER